MAFLGLSFGLVLRKARRVQHCKKRTISIEVGMQNAGLATVLAGTFFAAQPLAVLPCAISCAWHSISGTILAGIYLKWDHMHGRYWLRSQMVKYCYATRYFIVDLPQGITISLRIIETTLPQLPQQYFSLIISVLSEVIYLQTLPQHYRKHYRK